MNDGVGCLLVGVGLVVMVIVAALNQPSPTSMREAVEAYGFTHVAIGDPAFFQCGHDDWYRYKFIAKGPQNSDVEGVVCSGVFKSYTVRVTSSRHAIEAR